MTKTFRLISMSCSLILWTSMSMADDWYQVEVIAFEYTHPNKDEVELWDNHPGEPNWKDGMYLTDEATAKARRNAELAVGAHRDAPAPPPPPPPQPEFDENGDEITPVAVTPAVPEPPTPETQKFVSVEEILTGHSDHAAPKSATPSSTEPLAFVALPSSQFTMGDVVSKLSKKGSYRILSHITWRQPAISKKEESVHVFGGRLLDKDNPALPHYEFDGLVTLRTSRYLHLDVDAVLREPMKSSGGKYDSPADMGLLESANGGHDRMSMYQVYRVTQSQRVRTNKLYYFDHPLMGVIVKISPYGG